MRYYAEIYMNVFFITNTIIPSDIQKNVKVFGTVFFTYKKRKRDIIIDFYFLSLMIYLLPLVEIQ